MLDRFAASDVPQFLMAALSLGAVLLLIAAVGWLTRRLPALQSGPSLPGTGIALRGTLRLDTRRRLHLVEVGGQQALVLTGGASDVIVHLPPARS